MFKACIFLLALAALRVSASVGGARSSEPFNVDRVRTMFRGALLSDAQGNTVLEMQRYVAAYTELTRVFDFFGIVFSFARDDILVKLTTLTRLRMRDQAQQQTNYDTFESMFAYEYSQQACHLDKPGVNSNRWIHRALRFISRLLEEVKKENTQRDLVARLRYQYDTILAPQHHFFVRVAARMALYSFPSRGSFIRQVNLRDDAAGVESLTRLVQTLDDVYNHAQELYQDYCE